MAAVNYQGSSPSSFSHCKYQVFLSFRGKDTRKNFTDHLYRALVQAGIHTFRDDDEIQRGENIELELENAIKQSKISIVVFSKDYASSRWCLDELVKITEQSRTAGWVVLPVFYGVEPSHVRHQTGSFATSFVEHEKRFKEEMQRVNGWRIALKKVADLGGMELRDGYEAQFVESIVKEVSKKLDRRIFHVPLHFIGRDSRIDYINSWLQDGSRGAAIAILYGVGGVGKTTIAKSVYNQNFYKFEGGSFLANVRERSKESNGLVCLQRQLLSDILNKNANEINDVDEGIIKIKDAVCCRKTLIVLDDVEKRDQLNAIIGMQNFLCRGSKIIVTTRNKSLISVHDERVEFPIKPLDDKESLELFSWHAFGRAHPIEDLAEHSKRMVRHCKGLPLALGVIGSSLCGKRTKVWESALQDIEVIPNSEVLNVLKVSYDSLDDSYQKKLFLDIACFFNGMKESYVVKILDELGIGAAFRIDNLIDRCLLEIDNDERLWMHQLIRDMGREVARQESSKCQRIWHPREACTVLEGPIEDAATVRGLTLDMHALKEDNCKVFCTDAFRKMQNVKFLQLHDVKFDGSYKLFPKSLVWLCWHGFSLRSMPKHLCLEKLVVLDLSRSSLVDVWKGKMYLPKLKILDLRHSLGLHRTPDLSGLPCLEELILEGCIWLDQIDESIGDLSNLLILNLRNCTRLVELPGEVSRLDSLQVLDLHGCSNLSYFSKMELLNMDLEQLQPHWSSQKDGIVASISYIAALSLKLFLHSWFSTRNIISRRSCFVIPCSLVTLNLSGTPIRSLPESITGLSTLKYLCLLNCQMLQTLPQLPSNVEVLLVNFCFLMQTFPSLPKYTLIDGCEKLVHIQDIFKLGLIQKASLHLLRILETIIFQRQPHEFQIHIMGHGDKFHVLLIGRNEFPMFYEEGGEWVIQNEFKEYLSFKISTISAEHRIICGLDLFTVFSATAESQLIKFIKLTKLNCTRLIELPEEVSGLDSLKVLVLDGCSNLGCFRKMELLNMDLEQLQPHWCSQKDGIVASISYITALPLKLFLQYSWFSTRNIISRRNCLAFPCSLVTLNLSGTPIRYLPESIMDLSTVKVLLLRNCQMLQTLPQLPSNVLQLNVDFCFSLQTIPSLPQYTHVLECEKLVHIQDIFKLELIQNASIHILRIMEMVIVQKQPLEFQVHLIGHDNIFHVLLIGRNEIPMFNEEGCGWVIQNEFKEYLSFKISTISTEHRICGFYLSTVFSATSESELRYALSFEIKNNTKGRSRWFNYFLMPYELHEEIVEFSWLSEWKCELGEIDDGDVVSVSVHSHDPCIQIKRVGVGLRCKEEGSGNEVMIRSHSSSSNNEVIVAHNNSSSNWDSQTLGDEHVARSQIAAYIFSNYYCRSRVSVVYSGDEYGSFIFRKK